MAENWIPLALALLALGLASAVKGAIGFGLPLMAVPIVSSILDPRTAVLVVAIPVLLSNLMMIARGGGRREDLARLALLGGTLVVGTALGAQLLASLDLRALSVLVGLSALAFVGANAARLNLVVPPKQERVWVPAIGLLSGVLGGSTSIYGLLMTSYLHALRLPRRAFVFSITLMFTLGNVTQVVTYWQLGLYSGPTLLYALLACVPTFLGTWVGIRLQDVLPLRVWNALVLGFILLSGLNLVVRGLFGG